MPAARTALASALLPLLALLLLALLPPTGPGFSVPAAHPAPDGTPATTADELLARSKDQPLPGALARHVGPSCAGTGTDGSRVQVLYARERSAPDRYAAVVPAIQDAVAWVDDLLAVSARKTGGGRRMRWVHDGAADCAPTVLDVVLPDGSFDRRFGYDALADLGMSRPDRKYLMFADATGQCGISTTYGDHRKFAANRNNGGDGRSSWARLDPICWTGSTAAHEAVHFLGAVQHDAPHTSGAFHCWDGRDTLCYDDKGRLMPAAGVGTACADDPVPLLDCGGDDYFSTDPPAGSYLARHWNTADSAFLDTVPPLGPPPTLELSGPGRVVHGRPARFEARGSGLDGAPAWTVEPAACRVRPDGPASALVTCPEWAGKTASVSASGTSADGQGARARAQARLVEPPLRIVPGSTARTAWAKASGEHGPAGGRLLTLLAQDRTNRVAWRRVNVALTGPDGVARALAPGAGTYRWTSADGSSSRAFRIR